MARPHAYLRKSSVKNLATDLSPETQERAVRALAARHNDNGDRLVVLADWDISGSGRYTKKRLGYQQLLAAIKSGDCSAVYSYSLSRLGRSVHELTGLFALCAATHVPVRLVADAVDTSTASGVLLANVLASVAQFESDVAGERQRARYATLRALGREVRTTRRYGEKTGDNGEAEDVQAVLGAFRDAGSYSGAARLLNERGVKPRNSKRGWWPSSVAVIVQRLDGGIRTGTRGAKAIAPPFTLARLLHCPTCGTRLTGLRDRLDGSGRGRIRYACRLGSVKPHDRVSISEHLILPSIRAEAEHLRRPEEVVETRDVDPAMFAELEQKRARIIETYFDGVIGKPERDRGLQLVDKAMERLDVQRVVRKVPAISDIDWDDPKKANGVLRALFERIDLDPGTFQPVRFDWTVPEWRSEVAAMPK